MGAKIDKIEQSKDSQHKILIFALLQAPNNLRNS